MDRQPGHQGQTSILGPRSHRRSVDLPRGSTVSTGTRAQSTSCSFKPSEPCSACSFSTFVILRKASTASRHSPSRPQLPDLSSYSLFLSLRQVVWGLRSTSCPSSSHLPSLEITLCTLCTHPYRLCHILLSFSLAWDNFSAKTCFTHFCSSMRKARTMRVRTQLLTEREGP